MLGFEHFDDYPAHSPYMGAIAGRYANRIGGGRFTIAGQRYQSDRNFLGKHTLHGGAKGFGKRMWDVALHGDDFVTLTLHSPDGDMGFPGALDVTCTYRLKIPGTLSVELTATTRRADAVQPRAPFLFQPRRWRQRRRSRPPPDAGGRRLSAGR